MHDEHTPPFASLTAATRERVAARLRVEELSREIFRLKRLDPRPTDFEERRLDLNAQLRSAESQINVVDAWIEDHRRERADRHTSTKMAAIEANVLQSEMALRRDRERSSRHNAAREEKIDLLVGLVRRVTPVLARCQDPEATEIIDEIRQRAPWLFQEAS
jgi:vacuolar-type H+-ATPase subunit I/STV1